MRGPVRQCGPFALDHHRHRLDGIHDVAEDVANGRP
jgi:hypothetical protein